MKPKPTERFYEELGMSIRNVLEDRADEEGYDWDCEDALGFKVWRENGAVKVEIM